MTTSKYFAHPSAIIDSPCNIGENSKIWHFVHICENATIGNNCILGQNVMIGSNITIGNNVKIQNNVSVYEGIVIEDDVFLGPSCVLTNISNPRSQIVRRNLYENILIKKGATIGANATITPNVTIGKYAFVAAGAVVTRNIPDYACFVGVPAKHYGWMSRHGHMLDFNEKFAECPESKWRYSISENVVKCDSYDEEKELLIPNKKAQFNYQYYKK